MITKQDLEEAIAECQGTRNPNAGTCLKLASYYVIRDHLYEEKKNDPAPIMYQFSGPKFSSDTEFGRLLQDKGESEVLEVVDELMETLRVMEPRLYKAFIRKITAL